MAISTTAKRKEYYRMGFMSGLLGLDTAFTNFSANWILHQEKDLFFYISGLHLDDNEPTWQAKLHSIKCLVFWEADQDEASLWIKQKQISVNIQLKNRFKGKTSFHSPLGLLNYDKNHNHVYFGQYCNHDYLTRLWVGHMNKTLNEWFKHSDWYIYIII